MDGLSMRTCRNKILWQNRVPSERLSRKIIPSALFLVLCDHKVRGWLPHLSSFHREKMSERFNLVMLTLSVQGHRGIAGGKRLA